MKKLELRNLLSTMDKLNTGAGYTMPDLCYLSDLTEVKVREIHRFLVKSKYIVKLSDRYRGKRVATLDIATGKSKRKRVDVYGPNKDLKKSIMLKRLTVGEGDVVEKRPRLNVKISFENNDTLVSINEFQCYTSEIKFFRVDNTRDKVGEYIGSYKLGEFITPKKTYNVKPENGYVRRDVLDNLKNILYDIAG